jgi:hypothetical protein
MPKTLCLVAFLLALPSVAAAQSPADQAAGRALFDEGMELLKKDQLNEACPKFEASLRRFPGIGTRGKLAECYERQGRTASAWATYRELAAVASRAGDEARAKIAAERAKALEGKLARITIVLSPGADVTGLTIQRDGGTLERGELDSAVAVDPGAHTVKVEAPGRKPWTSEINVAPAGSARLEIPVLEELPVAAVPPPSAPVTETPVSDRVAEKPGVAWQRIAGVATAGAGAGAIIAGTYFGLTANSNYSDAFDRNLCDGRNTCNPEGQDLTDRARSQATVSTILFAAGGILATTGVVLYFTAPSQGRGASGMRVVPTFGQNGAGLSIGGRL